MRKTRKNEDGRQVSNKRDILLSREWRVIFEIVVCEEGTEEKKMMVGICAASTIVSRREASMC